MNRLFPIVLPAKSRGGSATRSRALSGRRVSRRRSGVEVLELLLVTPVIVVLLVATIQFGSVHLIDSAITHASTVGVREAAQEADVGEVAVEVDKVLQPHGIDVVTALGSPVDGTQVILEVGTDVTKFSNLSFQPPPPASPEFPELGPGEVRVTVYVKLDKTPIINVKALEEFGFIFPGEYFQVSSVAKLE